MATYSLWPNYYKHETTWPETAIHAIPDTEKSDDIVYEYMVFYDADWIEVGRAKLS